MAHWRIDSLDGRGGVAFASWRDFSLADELSELRETPCVVLSAPFFQPEPMASRALGRFANHGMFQTGVFAGESELSFLSLEALREFVRRTYLRFGGSDGLEGGGAPIPPAPEGGTSGLLPFPESPLDLLGPHITVPEEGDHAHSHGKRERPDSETVPASIDLVGFLRSLRVRSEELTDKAPINGELTFSQPFQPGGLPTIGQITRSEDILGYATLILIHGVLERLPAVRQLDQLLRWQNAAKAVGHTIALLGLWDWLFSSRPHKVLNTWTEAMYKSGAWIMLQSELAQIKSIPNLNEDARTRIILWLLFGASPTIDYTDWISWIRTTWEEMGGKRDGRLQPGPLYRALNMKDPIETLKLIPLPDSFVPIISKLDRRDANLYHFLAAATACPLELHKNPTGGWSILLFAASLIVLDEVESPASFGEFGPWGTNPTRMQAVWMQDNMARAWQWLARSLPSRIFPSHVETMISDVTGLRYDGGGVGGARRRPGQSQAQTA
jgi:hypothetical protein